jgi:hypothetical protein
MSNTVAAPLSANFTNVPANIAPGTSSSFSLVVTIPAGTGTLTNNFQIRADRGSQFGVTSATANVVVAPSTTMNAIGGPFPKRATVPMSAVSSIPGSSVVFTIVKPNGTTTKTATAGANGVASTSLKLGGKDPAGDYKVTARSTANGLQGPVSNQVIFKVQ